MEITLSLITHVVTGTVGVLAGTCALTVKKGQNRHRQAGKVFSVSMLIMAASGTLIAYQKSSLISVIAGLFTCYLIISAWMTVRTPARTITRWDCLLPIFCLLIGFFGMLYGVEAAYSETGQKNGYSAEPYFFFGVLALLAAGLDIRLLMAGGISGAHRLARHLWRMCFAMYLAVGSMFSQGAKSLPESVRESIFISIPENLMLLLLLYWLSYVLVRRLNNGRYVAT